MISNVPKMTSNDLKLTSKNTNENGKKVKAKNSLGVGDPNDNPTQGKAVIEPHSSSI